MRIVPSVVLLLLVTLGASHAKMLRVDRIEFLEYGIYTLDREVQGKDETGIKRGVGSNIRHAASLRTIPTQLGITFGFRYKVIGSPYNMPIDLRALVVFPAHGLRPSLSTQPIPQFEFTQHTKIGEMGFASYTLEDSFELVRGPWAIEIWYADRKLGTQNFTLVDPASECVGNECEGF
jgi:hypothetical protein